MCGISGFVDFKFNSNNDLLAKMVATLHHRGPDDSGCEVYSTKYASVGFGHTRLSILDLSPAGHQPMNYEHLSIVLNGEIYNFNEIKTDLIRAGHSFKSESDTEVVLHAFLEWGDACVTKFIGMFAFVILDHKTKVVTIVRDRAGVKPLFYYWENGLFLFASELKAFHQHPNFIKRLNENAVHQYMDFGFVPSPYCIFENCGKLNPGHFLTLSLTQKTYKISKYWDVNDYYRLPPLHIDYSDAQKEVEKLLLSACEYRMVSDVPVGVFLSGGYDSTGVTAMLQSSRTEKLKTFTIGFDEGNNEAPYAKAVAQYLGTDHTEYYCTTKEAQEIIPTLPFLFDEPFADSSAIPTILVSKLARNNVTVALSADGGDEIFAGYEYYKNFQNNLAQLRKVPKSAKGTLSTLTHIAGLMIPNKNIRLKNKLDVLSRVLATDDKRAPQILQKCFYTLSTSHKNELYSNSELTQRTAFDNDFSEFRDILSVALATDYVMYLQNDILTKVDRATMSVSLEGREPFMDHRIIEFAAQLPTEFKLGASQKKILKDVVHRYVPQQLMDRPKAGFSVPIDYWLKKDLSSLLEEHLSLSNIKNTGLFRPLYVNKLKKDFYNGALYQSVIIWKLLQFQMWFKAWM